MSNWEETPGQTPDMLEILHLSAALRTPLYAPDEAKVVAGEIEVHTYLLTQLPQHPRHREVVEKGRMFLYISYFSLYLCYITSGLSNPLTN